MPGPDWNEMPDDSGPLSESGIAPEELERRREIVDRILAIRSRPAESAGPFPSAEQMLRDDRAR